MSAERMRPLCARMGLQLKRYPASRFDPRCLLLHIFAVSCRARHARRKYRNNIVENLGCLCKNSTAMKAGSPTG